MSNQEIKKWLKEDSTFMKIKVNEEFIGIFKGMRFDPKGGYQGKSTVRYSLQDLEDGKTREFSSSSKALANDAMKLVVGDKISIKGVLNEKEQKTYELRVLEKVGGAAPEETKSDEIPF